LLVAEGRLLLLGNLCVYQLRLRLALNVLIFRLPGVQQELSQAIGLAWAL
jgi:hypothetical protein